jgi:hypothetical protein
VPIPAQVAMPSMRNSRAQEHWAVNVVLVVLLSLSGLIALSARPYRSAAQDAVPPAYQPLYTYLADVLDATKSAVDTNQPTNPVPLTFGAELLTANGNRGQQLLDPGTLTATALLLNRLQELGVQGVTVAIKYPLYTPNDPRFHDYRNFYRQVAAAVRRRGMKLDVEATVLFAGTPFTSEDVSFAGLNFERFEAEDRQMVQDIIADLSPDYLTVIDEPSTEAALTGIAELNDPAHELDLVGHVLDGLDRGRTLVGAGAGSWESADFVKLLAADTDLDYIGVHIYPLTRDTAHTALTMAEYAHQYGKRVLIEETWLYKAGPQEQVNGVAANTAIFQRDAYSFFAPLDQEFLYNVTGLAHLMGAEYLSPFWSGFFFGYADYTAETAVLPYRDLVAAATRQQSANLLAGAFSATGLFYSQLICASTRGCAAGQ